MRPQHPTRRALLGAGTAAAAWAGLGACTPDGVAPLQGGWVGPPPTRGHRLRDQATTPASASAPASAPASAIGAGDRRQAAVLIVGGGIAGLAAARAFMRRGVDDVHVLELEDTAGGNARGHALAGMACPLGAHYLPLPTPEAHEVSEWLHEIGLLRSVAGRTVADERHLCHSPQERLFFEGQWIEGLLPPAAPGSRRLAQYRAFAAQVAAAQRLGGATGGSGTGGARAFALPAHRSAWTPEHAALDAITFEAWLTRDGLDEPALRTYLDYCCRDDYGAGLASVSAWAGLHYFASRHGFHAHGDTEQEREPVFTWPEGNAWLATRLAAPLGPRLHTARTVLAVEEQRHGVQVLALDEHSGRAETWTATTVVLAVPLRVAARQLRQPPNALKVAAEAMRYAPWLVANLHLPRPLLERVGAPMAWDNVIHGSAALGYVNAMHQSLRPEPGATVLTAYHALPVAERASLLADDWRPAAERLLAELAGAHPDLRERVQRVDLMRWGHAMAIPRPGLQRHAALMALRQARGRVRFAHADLAGYSVFEEAFTAGTEAATSSP